MDGDVAGRGEGDARQSEEQWIEDASQGLGGKCATGDYNFAMRGIHFVTDENGTRAMRVTVIRVRHRSAAYE